VIRLRSYPFKRKSCKASLKFSIPYYVVSKFFNNYIMLIIIDLSSRHKKFLNLLNYGYGCLNESEDFPEESWYA